MTGAGVALDAKQGRGMLARKAGREGAHVDTIENLLNVTAAILRRERAATTLPLAEPVVLLILQLAQFCRWRQLRVVAVLDRCVP